MKHLTRFLTYIKENNDIDMELVMNDFLVPIKHLGVKVDTYKSIVTDGQFEGHYQTTIGLDFKKFKRVDDKENKDVVDEKIWELLDEIITFRNMIDDTYKNTISLWLNPSKISLNIYSKIEKSNSYLLTQLYNKLSERFGDGYNRRIYINMLEEGDTSITGYINGTELIWKRFIKDKDIDLSNFDVSIIDTPENEGYWSLKSKLKVEIKIKE